MSTTGNIRKPIIVSLVQFENDFNFYTKISDRVGGCVKGGYLRPDQFLDHLTMITKERVTDITLVGGVKKVKIPF